MNNLEKRLDLWKRMNHRGSFSFYMSLPILKRIAFKAKVLNHCGKKMHSFYCVENTRVAWFQIWLQGDEWQDFAK